ncbi:MAG TPA: hydantoinase/oxoprolinase family protein, partial [Roseiflexaceae bacterium]|nr:hydantoinase/oxoprolinase family protein [Roseiflexaceae bacterium]
MDILGIDIGGTFTDFVLLRGGRVHVHKLLSTPEDPSRALLQGVADLGAPAAVVHGTTVATNALLERRGAPTALVATAGFGDVLAIGRGDRPSLYDLDVARPAPIIPEDVVFEVRERILHDGAVLQPLEPAELERLASWLARQPVEAVAICLLHSYANPAHEQLIVERLHDGTFQRANVPTRFISASHRVLPEQREYERASTTAVNAYVAPALGRYLARVEGALAAQGMRSLRIMASDGGSMGLATARELPARATLSGPAGGVVGARFVAGRAGFDRVITFDMGGTSTDVALCDGSLPRSAESRVGGLPVRLPSLDIHTVGAGGGSLARLDAGGALRVGPQSAGADPGPACYGRGTQPTVTDANLLLGRLQPQAFLGGRMALDVARAETALAPLAAALYPAADGRPMTDDRRRMRDDERPATDDQTGAEVREGVPISTGIDSSVVGRRSMLRTALGVVRVANAAMERAIRAISVERGDDPRDFVLVAFGGAGPLHAAYLAEALGMRRVLVPRYPGVLSALGMLAAHVTRSASRALLAPLDALDPAALRAHMDGLAAEGLAALAADGEPPERCRVDFALDLRYAGQSYEITTPLAAIEEGQAVLPEILPLITVESLAACRERFHALHERRYGHAMRSRPVEAVLLRATATSVRP